MPKIDRKKDIYSVGEELIGYLTNFHRTVELPVKYEDLLEYEGGVALIDKHNVDTLWETVYYGRLNAEDIHQGLKKVYAILKAHGDMSVIAHLFIDRIDICLYGNTKPFRVRVVNKINDNFDYFYVKRADASRIYGLELEHITSPNRISFLVEGNTLVEEHIVGIPGDMFIKYRLKDDIHAVRLAKEFIKFNERCFVRLLGDMHCSNFVIDITPDFEEVSYRIKAIDFDQQSYEGRKVVYMPQYFKQNNPILNLGFNTLTPETVKQYQKEEHSTIGYRLRAIRGRINKLLKVMEKEHIAPESNVNQLKMELAEHYEDMAFMQCKTMGELVRVSLQRLV